MTDRVHSLVVVLDKDIRVDDVEGLVSAIEHLRGVIKVSNVKANFDSHMAEVRTVTNIRKELNEFLDSYFSNKSY